MKVSTPPQAAESGSKPRLFVVDDHALFAEALINALQATNEFEIVGMANDAASARQQLPAARPDILLVDLMMPGESGLELIQYAVSNQLATHVIACSGTSNRHSVAAGIACGARCFFGKTSTFEVLLNTLREVIKGQAPMGEFERTALREMVAGKISAGRFSPRELEILRYLANNECPKEIGEKVGLSVSAVYKTKNRLLAQANVDNIFLLALQLGIAPSDGRTAAERLKAK